mmetsp:Transcript_7794/g.12903  ORF Transcript_7794/g.12903 Transcript_7794/m.12903 type:complete len:423 (-) Transcript_7794:85-1353(-)
MMAQKETVKHKRRYCRSGGCTRIVKSQGLCQRHGAKTRKCKIDGCEKQAQGNFDGMCKLHFKITKTQLIAAPPTIEDLTPEPVGESVYDSILPESIGWSSQQDMMPLVKHLKEGFDNQKTRGWHRSEERRARGLPPVTNPAIQLEGWERELVWHEILLLSGCPQSSFRHLARSWGRDKGFHMVLAQFICERRGNVERKKRVKGESAVTKKSRRAPMEMAPSGEEALPNVMELDDVDLDMLGVLGDDEVDPTVNFTSVPNFSNLGKRGLRRMAPIEIPVRVMQHHQQMHQQQQQMHQQQQQHMQSRQVSHQIVPEMYHPGPLPGGHPGMSAGHQHAMNNQQQQQQQMQHQQLHQHQHAVVEHHNYVINGVAPPPMSEITKQASGAMMSVGKMITHEDLACDENISVHQQQQGSMAALFDATAV